MKQELEDAKRLAEAAGKILLDCYSRPPTVDWKGPNDPVTAADRAASTYLSEELARLYPQDGILSEEAIDDPLRLSRPRVWIIDPMDGTKEYIHRVDEFSVMIGLAIDGTPALGVVYQPTQAKLFYASREEGAFLKTETQEIRLRVSSEARPERMTIALSRSHHSDRIDTICHRLGIERTIRSGSLGLKVALIAEGRAHLYLNTSRRTFQWDTCAPEAILREAGGRMTDLRNVAFEYNRSDVRNLEGVLATNGTFHDRIVEEIRENKDLH